MKDLVTGLPIASIQHLPQQLQDALLRGQRNVTPLLYFAETARKISKGGTRRYEKERLIVITPDSLNVYATDGSIKRRVKLTDISAVVFTRQEPFRKAQLGGDLQASPSTGSMTAATAGSGSSTSAARSLAGEGHMSGASAPTCQAGRNINSSRLTASFGLRIPSQYDMAFDIVSRDDAATPPDQLITNLIRVIGVLQASYFSSSSSISSPPQNNGSLSSSSELRVVMISSSSSPSGGDTQKKHVGGGHPKMMWDLLSLKKPPLSTGRGAASGSNRQPLLAPILPIVTEESERQKQLDARLQVDEAISDLLDQLEKYSNESVFTKATACLQRLEQYARHFQSAEDGEHRIELKERWLRARSEKCQRQHASLQDQITNARENLLCWIHRIEQLRNDHEDTVRKIRHDVAECDERGEALEVRIKECESVQVDELFQLDTRRQELEEVLRSSLGHLETRELLPSMAALRDEISSLTDAADKVRESIGREQERIGREREVSNLRGLMLEENVALEALVLESMTKVREEKEATKQLALKVSLALAKRNRLVASCENGQRLVQQLEQDGLDLASKARGQQHIVNALTDERELLESEQLVVTDLNREAVMHDSITTSVATIAINEEKRRGSAEVALKEQLEKLRQLKFTLLQQAAQKR